MILHLVFVLLSTMANASEVEKQCSAGETCGSVMLQRQTMHEGNANGATWWGYAKDEEADAAMEDFMYPDIDEPFEPELEAEPEPEPEAEPEPDASDGTRVTPAPT